MKPIYALAFVGLAACTVQSSNPDPVVTTPAPTLPADGTLTVDWTIDGTTDPNRCNQSVSSSFQISIAFDDGTFAGTFQQTCSAFATSIQLAPGRYTARAELIDGVGQPRTTSIEVVPFTVLANSDLTVPVDFPADSFF